MNKERYPRLLVDFMLGRLAKKLRLAGFDAEYHSGDDESFIHRALSERRIPVTRDRALAKRRVFRREGIAVIVPDSNDYHRQFEFVLKELKKLGYKTPVPFSRCPLCNSDLLKLKKFSACTFVPAYVFLTTDNFKICPHCRRIFWRGTHFKNFTEDLNLKYSHEKK